MAGQMFFFDVLAFVSGAEGFMRDASCGFAYFFHEARGQQGVVMGVGKVHELILNGRTTGVDNKNFHNGPVLSIISEFVQNSDASEGRTRGTGYKKMSRI